jgi:hypothetical protein
VYQPVVFTAKDDNSIGITISGSSGSPSGYYGGGLVFLGTNQTQVGCLRMNYANQGLTVAGAISVQDAQMNNCELAFIPIGGGSVDLRNVLFVQNNRNIGMPYYATGMVYSANCTFAGSSDLVVSPWGPDRAYFFATNCLFVNMTNLGDATLDGWSNGLYNTASFGHGVITPSANPLQSVGAGSCYLAADSSCQNAGSTNLPAGVLSLLRERTTVPPVYLSSTGFASGLVLVPQAARDTDAPGLGYHYPVLDYLIDWVSVTNASVTISNGAVVGYTFNPGLMLRNGTSISSAGLPNAMNSFVPYGAVQEQPVKLGTWTSGLMPIHTQRGGSSGPGAYRFTQILPPLGGTTVWSLYSSQGWEYSSLDVRDCFFAGGGVNIDVTAATNVVLRNNIFDSEGILILDEGIATCGLEFGNNLVRHGSFEIDAYGNTWTVRDSVFDNTTANDGGDPACTRSHNGFINTDSSAISGTGDVTLTNFTWQAGPLGPYYQPTNSAFIDHGSVSDAGTLGLYHYTTLTNQVKEGNSTLDIGFHYVPVDGNGNPLDTNGDGIPDVFEDVNGNGLVDNGELGWNWPEPVFHVWIAQPRDNATIP